MRLFNTLRNKIKYLRRDKNFKSDINVPGSIECSLIYTNDFDSYDDDDTCYFSSVYILFQFDKDGNDLSNELIEFCNVLNIYGFNYRRYNDDINAYLILEGSIIQYDDLIFLFYHHDMFESFDYRMSKMYMNNFLSTLMRVLSLIPIQYFQYADTDECEAIWNVFQANPVSKSEKSKIKDLINDKYRDSNEIILLEIDRVYETNKSIFQDDNLMKIVQGMSCNRVAIPADRISEMDGMTYSDSATNVYTKGGKDYYLIKLQNDFLYSFANDYKDKELVNDILSVIPDGYKYTPKDDDIDNDSYYSDIDEIIE